MGNTLYYKCKELLKEYPRGMQIGIVLLSNEIMINIGSDPRTIENALKTMITTKLIKDIGNCHFEILKGKEDKIEDEFIKV
jgi:hypothetical protein